MSHFLHILATAETYTKIGTKLYEEHRPDVFAVYYEGIDSVSHLFMKYADPPMPGHSEENRQRYRDLVSTYYEYQDEAVGRYLSLAGPDAYVIVVSDHGFKTGAKRLHEGDEVQVGMAHQWHDLDGVILMRGPGIKAGEELVEVSVLDVTPTLLYMLGLPVGEDMDGSVMLDAFRPSFLTQHEIRRIASYEGGAPESEAVSVEENIARAMEERLKGLGYIGATSEDSSPEIHMNLAKRHLDQGNLVEAERELKTALRLRSDQPAPHLQLAELYLKQKRFAEARSELQAAALLEEGNLGLWMRVANVSALGGDLEEALAALQKIAKLDPKWPGVDIAMGDVLNRMDKLDEAEAALRRAVTNNAESAAAHFNLGVVLERTARLDDAAAEYRRTLELEPHHPYARNNLGNVLSRKGDHEAALVQFQAAVKASPENFEALYNYGTTCLRLDKREEALEYLK
ncbi:MAG: tetratricopeptide repeat protein, partial [Planctomycetota bacterium]